MKRLSWKPLIFWNLCSFAVAMSAPVTWVSPLSTALTAAAGFGAAWAVLPGAVAGNLAGAGGAGGVLSCLAAWAGAACSRRFQSGRDAFSALWALACCLTPALIRYASRGTYSLLTAIATALVALAAAPVWSTLFSHELLSRPELCADERIALHFLAAAAISGLCRLCAPLGLMAAGAFSLLCAGEGVLCGCAAAFPAGLALILGGSEALPALLLLISAGAAGLGRACGRWTQAPLFLCSLPLLYYYGWDPSTLALFGASVVYPLLPERLCAAFVRRFFARANDEPPAYRVIAARRHLPVRGQRLSGDSGAIELLPRQRMLLLLADGMGTGLSARRLSERAVREARRILRAALDDRTAYRALNRLLLSGENSFTALETCVIDLNRGLACFHKCGSETAWVVRGQRARRFRGSALPLGIVPEAPPSVLRVQLRPGDTILLATDGLVAALGGEDGTERVLLSLIHHSPQEICARMLRLAQSETLAHPDDMSALCARIALRSAAEEEKIAERQAS